MIMGVSFGSGESWQTKLFRQPVVLNTIYKGKLFTDLEKSKCAKTILDSLQTEYQGSAYYTEVTKFFDIAYYAMTGTTNQIGNKLLQYVPTTLSALTIEILDLCYNSMLTDEFKKQFVEYVYNKHRISDRNWITGYKRTGFWGNIVSTTTSAARTGVREMSDNKGQAVIGQVVGGPTPQRPVV